MVEDIFDISVIVKCSSFHSVPPPQVNICLLGSRIFTAPYRPDRLWGPPNLLSNGYWGLFGGGGEAAGAWSWLLTSYECQGKENMAVYIHSPIPFHGVVLN
jgi:hypothetical protein